MLVPPHFWVSIAFKKMRWKDEFRKWLPKLSNNTKFDFTVDEGKERLNPSRDKN